MSLLRGRFKSSVSDLMQRFSSSLEVDLRMLDEDIEGSKAHATMLGETGIISAKDARTLTEGLDTVRGELASGAWVPGIEHEDIHMAVEARLTELVGPVGGKLHTARSRNDQVATDLRLWLRRGLGELDLALRELLETLLQRAETDGHTLMPGYTHLQRGQPIFLGHQLLAHAFALSRDRGRFQDALARLNRCPLGACAMAGTPHPIDRQRTAELLGFGGVAENAMDAVAARDHAQEVAAAATICMTNLSRMAEELVLWSSAEFAFIRLSGSFATGSSIMPQKRNPDAAELVRGKAGRVAGAFTALTNLVKSLPLAYNRDLQEDREALFDAVETTRDCLRIMAGAWSTLAIESRRFEDELQGDFSLATELADDLSSKGVPFREAHDTVGHLVQALEAKGETLSALTPERARSFHPKLGDDLESLLDPRKAAERRSSYGGTAWSEVKRQLSLLRDAL